MVTIKNTLWIAEHIHFEIYYVQIIISVGTSTQTLKVHS